MNRGFRWFRDGRDGPGSSASATRPWVRDLPDPIEYSVGAWSGSTRAERRTPGRIAAFARRAPIALAVALLVVVSTPLGSASPVQLDHPASHPMAPPRTGANADRRTTTDRRSDTARFASSGASWYDLTGPSGSYPPNRTQAAFAFDPVLGADILFGGYNVSGYAYHDTWEYANGTWTNLTPEVGLAPPARWGALFAWDPAGQALVLFGGRNVDTDFGDTWIFDSSGWHAVTTSPAPSFRQDMVYGYDPELSAVYLFGGNCLASCGTSAPLNDSWTYSDGRWTDITRGVQGAPSGLVYGSWDPTDGYFLGYGNVTGCAVGGAHTYAFNGTGWRLLTGAVGPPIPETGEMVYDGVDRSVLVFGEGVPASDGACAPYPATWSYSAGIWTNLTASLPSAPYGRCCSALLYDPVEKVVLLEGGSSYIPGEFGIYTGEVWSYPVSPLRAAVNASRSLCAAPCTLTFRSTVSGGTGPYSDLWNYGDGSPISSGSAVTHTFAGAGIYPVRLTVADEDGRGANVTEEVTVLPPLVVTLSANRTRGPVPLAVSFSSEALGSEGPYAFSWTFGDEGASSGADVTHEYLGSGAFVAQVVVVDGLGDRDAANLTIVAYMPLVVTLSASPASVAVEGELRLDATVVGGDGTLAYTWSGLPTGCIESDAGQLSCRPTSAGNFVISVLVRDASGDRSSSAARVSISGAPNSAAGPLSELRSPTGWVVLVLFLGAIAGAAVWYRRKRGATGPAPPPPDRGASPPTQG